jgi:hypothetical protein
MLKLRIKTTGKRKTVKNEELTKEQQSSMNASQRYQGW